VSLLVSGQNKYLRSDRTSRSGVSSSPLGGFKTLGKGLTVQVSLVKFRVSSDVGANWARSV
jgi:hypothetical protein